MLAAPDEQQRAREREERLLWRKFLFAGVIGAFLIVAMQYEHLPLVSGLPMAAMTVTSFVLATPVQFWAGWQFYEGAWNRLRHLDADMNTLVAVGTSAAYLYSVFATFAPGLFRAADVEPGVYFDTRGRRSSPSSSSAATWRRRRRGAPRRRSSG